jgi:hypothetical protein
MALQQQPQTINWRAQVRNWLQSVDNHRRTFGVDLTTAAIQNRANFPKSTLVLFAGQILRSLATLIVKSALRDAATSLNMTLDDATLDALSDIVVTVLLSAP